MDAVRTLSLFIAAALAELVGCYLPFLWLRRGRSVLLLVPAAFSLGVFSWLLTLHSAAAGRTYAAYGGVYVALALVWLRIVERQAPHRWDIVGVAVTLVGMSILAFAPRSP
jgi:small multidrug resistance family-3 protein